MKLSVREFPRCTIDIDAPYLHLPVRIGAPRHWLEGWIGGTRVFAYYLELADEGPATTFFLDMQAFAGCRLTLVVDRVPRNRHMTVIFVEEALGY